MSSIIAADFSYVRPRAREELLELLATREGAKILAGGTDLLVDLRNGTKRPRTLVDLKGVAEFRDISWDEETGLRIGPSVTINDLLFHPVVRERFPLLVACAADLASHQIRNRATVAGNVVNASPCADMAPGLLCSRASAVIESAEGQRTVPFAEFFTGVKRTVLGPQEVLVRIEVPAEAADARADYRKLKRIRGHDLGIVGVAVWRKDDDIRVGVSSSAPTPLLVEGLGALGSIADMVNEVGRSISPISDVRCTAEYRSHMVQVYARRLLQEVS
jgi:CO/xanthine dehydrogenase FAD-binding subunit